MTASADNTAWRTAAPDAWVDDTTDVLHCSMPPQIRAHIEELRAEVVRLTAHAQQVEVPHSSAAVLAATSAPCDGFAWVGQSFKFCDNCGDPYWEHAFELRLGGPVAISPDRAAAVKRKWDA